MKKKALITGGAGFIGFHLARNLANQGYDVSILDNFSRGRKDEEFNELIKRDNVNFIRGDITKEDTFTLLGEEKFDYVYHLAAINGTENFYKIPDKVLKIGVLGIINVLDWFVKQNYGKVLFTSTSETYAGGLNLMKDDFPIPTPESVPLVVEDPTNIRWCYGGSKILGEVAMYYWAKAYDMKNFVIVRPHNIYGPRMGFEHVIPQFIERIVKGERLFKIFGGQETRTFFYIDDAVRAMQLVMESPETNGKTVNVGRSDGEIKIIDLAKTLFQLVGTDPEFDVRPAPQGSVKRRCPDVSILRSLGFNPEVSLEYGLGKCFHWYKSKFSS